MRRHRITIPKVRRTYGRDFEFNIPDIKLPSLYEVRRLSQPGWPK